MFNFGPFQITKIQSNQELTNQFRKIRFPIYFSSPVQNGETTEQNRTEQNKGNKWKTVVCVLSGLSVCCPRSIWNIISMKIVNNYIKHMIYHRWGDQLALKSKRNEYDEWRAPSDHIGVVACNRNIPILFFNNKKRSKQKKNEKLKKRRKRRTEKTKTCSWTKCHDQYLPFFLYLKM